MCFTPQANLLVRSPSCTVKVHKKGRQHNKNGVVTIEVVCGRTYFLDMKYECFIEGCF